MFSRRLARNWSDDLKPLFQHASAALGSLSGTVLPDHARAVPAARHQYVSLVAHRHGEYLAGVASLLLHQRWNNGSASVTTLSCDSERERERETHTHLKVTTWA